MIPSSSSSRCWRSRCSIAASAWPRPSSSLPSASTAQTSCSRVPRRSQSSQRLGDAGPALRLASPARLEPGEPGEPEREVGLLVALAGEPDRLAVGRLGDRPAVGGGVVARDQVEHERQRADRRACPRALERAVEQRAAGRGLAEEDRRAAPAREAAAGRRAARAMHRRARPPPGSPPTPRRRRRRRSAPSRSRWWPGTACAPEASAAAGSRARSATTSISAGLPA